MSQIEKRVRTQASQSMRKLNPGFFNPTHTELGREMVKETRKWVKNEKTGEITAVPVTENMSMTEVGLSLKMKSFINVTSNEGSLNKTEASFLALLRTLGHLWIGIQCWKINLGDNCGYTPDFIVLDKDGQLHAIEVKGFWRDDARVKIKVAARTYRFIKFSAVQYKNKSWIYEDIKP